MLFRYIMSLFSDRYPFVNGEFIPPQTKATVGLIKILDTKGRIHTVSPEQIVSKSSAVGYKQRNLNRKRRKQKRGF